MENSSSARYGLQGRPVTITGLNKSYGNLRVLHDIHLDIAAGEFCTLLGASGSGKTTMLKVLAGFEPFDEGRLEVGGRDISNVPVSKRNIGMVFQNYALFPHMSVRENVSFGLDMRKVPGDERRRRVDEVLELVSLQDFADRLPGSLSGGQQQRVALARALVIRPDILLMDEPLGALDKNLRQSIQLQLKQLHRELGVTIVYVTHDQEEALHLSDNIVIMDEGRIKQSGPVRELYFKPNSSFVACFLGECNLLKDTNGREFGIRPEDIRLRAQGEKAAHLVNANVETVVFTGAASKIIARANDTVISANVANSAAVEGLERGAPVEFAFDEERVLRFGTAT